MFEFLTRNKTKYCSLTINNRIRAKYYPIDLSDLNNKFPGYNFRPTGCYHLQIRRFIFFWITLRVYPSLEGLLASHAWNYLTKDRRSSRRDSNRRQQTFDYLADYEDERLPQDYSEPR
jgi:hypothetical protein